MIFLHIDAFPSKKNLDIFHVTNNNISTAAMQLNVQQADPSM